MRLSEAKAYVMKLYQDEWLEQGREPIDCNSPAGALPFYNWLAKEHPEAMTFIAGQDKYQEIETWFR